MKATIRSKTFWLGVIEILVGVLQFVAGQPAPGDYHAVILIVAGCLTIIIRKLTTVPVAGLFKVPSHPTLPR